MTLDPSILIWFLILVAFFILFRAVWTALVLIVGLLVTGIIVLFVADALNGGTAIGQTVDLIAAEAIPFLIATVGAVTAWLRRVIPVKTTAKYDL